jgi:hypothetical protein
METIENLVKLRSGKVTGKIRYDLYVSLVCYILGLALTIYASVLYRSFNWLGWIIPVIGVIILALLVHNILLIREQNKLNSMNVSLHDMVSGIIQYFKGGYRLWRLAYPFGVIFLVFIISALLEYKNGGYKINHPGEFILVTVLMYVLIFIPMRYARNVNVQDLESCLKNLDEKEYSSNENIIRRHRIFLIIFAVGLALIVIGTLVLWYISAGK